MHEKIPSGEDTPDNAGIVEEKLTTVVKDGAIMGGTETVLEGQHLVVRGMVMRAEVRVKKGAKLTVEGALARGKIIVEKGGILDLQGANMGGTIIHEGSAETPQA